MYPAQMREFEKTKGFQIAAALSVALIVAALGGVLGYNHVTADQRPYMKISGGGFLCNYREGHASYSIVIALTKAVPPGSVLEASLENPSGPPFRDVQRLEVKARRYHFETPHLSGVEADHPYSVTVLLKAPDGTVLESIGHSVMTKVAPEIVPSKPLTIGPGYHRNPENR